MKLSVFLLIIIQPISCDESWSWCKPSFDDTPDGECFHLYTRSNQHVNFAEYNDMIVSEVREAQNGTGDSFIWLGLYCYKGKLMWTENCAVQYNNFNGMGNSSVDDFCAVGDPHFILDLEDSKWKLAPEGAVTSSLVCSYSHRYSICEARDNHEAVHEQHVTEVIILAVSLIIVIFFCLAVRFAIAKLIRYDKEMEEKRRNEEQLKRKIMEEIERSQIRRFDKWEIDRRFVFIDFTSKLGQGAFGSVYLGIIDSSHIPSACGKSILEELKNDSNTVAIKMLHESSDKQQQAEFFEEVDLMKRLGYHERLVNMLACATQSEPALLIIEFCDHGDLLNYMRERRQFMLGSADAISSIDISKIITQKQQLMFCVQIAYGMEYLSQRGFVHRDIAARNILVDKHESCKIGDFGLCREVEKEDDYYHSRGGRLPLKWMSPEAIERYDFSIASDVWAFGVLLFEIITLGGNPYPDWPAAEILNRLKRGRRMDRPDNCTDHMFIVMNSCWLLTPADRPSFSDLRMKMGIALEEVSEDDYYLKLNSRAMYYCTQSEIDESKEIANKDIREYL